MTSQERKSVGPGSISLYRAYHDLGYAGTYSEFSPFVRIAKRGPVEPVVTPAGTVWAIGLSQISQLNPYLEQHGRRSGRHRWLKAEELALDEDWLTTSQVMELMGYASRTSAYYLKRKVTTKTVAGRVLFNAAQVERLALDQEQKRNN